MLKLGNPDSAGVESWGGVIFGEPGTLGTVKDGMLKLGTSGVGSCGSDKLGGPGKVGALKESLDKLEI
jgi:hypothetical protein